MPLCPEHAAIEDMSNIKISWLIDMDELDIADGKKDTIAIDDASVGSIGSQTFFGDKSAGFTDDA